MSARWLLALGATLGSSTESRRRPWLVPQPFYAGEEWAASRRLISGAESSGDPSFGNATRLEVREMGNLREALCEGVEYVRFCGAGLGDDGPSKVAGLAGVVGLALESDSLCATGLDAAASLFPRAPVGDFDDPAHPPLLELSLRRNAIDGSANGALARCLRLFPRLRSLYLASNPLGDDGARLVCDALAGLPALETLELADCDLSDDAVEALARAAKRVRHVDLSRNPRVTGRAVAVLLQKCRALETLDVSGCALDDVDALVAALRRAPSLEAIALARAGLAPPAAARLINALAKSPTLRHLDLSDNPLTPLAARQRDKHFFLDKILPADDRLDSTCALCAAAAALRKPAAFPNLRALILNDVGARKPHDRLFRAALAKTPRPDLYLDLRANPLLLRDDLHADAAPPSSKRRDPPLVD